MRKSITESITTTVKDLNRSGLIDDITMKNIEKLCLPEIQEYSPEKIVSIRKKFKLSQAAKLSTCRTRSWDKDMEVGTFILNRLCITNSFQCYRVLSASVHE